MWKSGWKINKDWVKGKEKWMLLLVCGLILLILSFPPGSKKDKEEEAGSPVVQGQKKEIRTRRRRPGKYLGRRRMRRGDTKKRWNSV